MDPDAMVLLVAALATAFVMTWINMRVGTRLLKLASFSLLCASVVLAAVSLALLVVAAVDSA